MTEDPYDKLLDDAAGDYNKPGAVPRDEMWARIQAARSAAATCPTPGTAGRSRVWVWPGVGIAALLLLSAGILIGRRLERPALVANADTNVGRRDTAATSPVVARTVAPDSPRQSPQHAPQGSSQRLAEAVTSADPADSVSSGLAVRLVLLKHLAGTEAVITSFRASARTGVVDPQVTRWSRELLNTTRMLRASSVGDDPTMNRLLADLDLVLAQIAQYAANGSTSAQDLDLIEQSIAKRGVIAKLRTTIPARALPGNTRGL